MSAKKQCALKLTVRHTLFCSNEKFDVCRICESSSIRNRRMFATSNSIVKTANGGCASSKRTRELWKSKQCIHQLAFVFCVIHNQTQRLQMRSKAHHVRWGAGDVSGHECWRNFPLRHFRKSRWSGMLLQRNQRLSRTYGRTTSEWEIRF
jgi:hypothetical protein